MRRQTDGLGVLGGPNVLGEVFTSRTGSGSEFDANMAAIVNYMNSTPVKTTAAGRVKDEFAKWHSTLGYMDLHWSTDETYAMARNYRNEFNRANATIAAETAAVEHVSKTGMTSEQMFSEPARARTTSGQYATAEQPTVSPWTWAIAAAVGLGGLYALGKITTLAQLFRSKPAAHTANARRRSGRGR